MSDNIAFKYNKARNRDDAYSFPGVPLRDITEDEFKALPKHLQQSVKASYLYSPYEEEAADKPKPAPEKAAEQPTKAKE